MNCPHCAAWSDVAETRAYGNKAVSARVYVDPKDGARYEIRRVRTCANNHRFGTIETIERLPGLLRRRNRQIANALSGGASAADTAARFGVSKRTVNRVYAQSRDKDAETDRNGNRAEDAALVDHAMRAAL